MKKLISIFSMLFIFFKLFPTQGMELVVQENERTNSYSSVALSNKEELSLLDVIKSFIQLSATCKEYNKRLTCVTIGDYCKNYSQYVKNRTLNDLVKDMCPNLDYTHKRLTVLTLVCAGANQIWGYRLILQAVQKSDTYLVNVILQYNENVDVNIEISLSNPCSMLFAVKNVEIAQQLITRGANVHEVHPDKNTNILWSILGNEYPTNLMEFYLTQNVDATSPNPLRKKETLLHRFAATSYSGGISNLDNFMQKAKLLFSIIPDKINALDERRRSPRDIVEISLKTAKNHKNKVATVAFKALILLFQEHGVFLMKEKAKQKVLKVLKE